MPLRFFNLGTTPRGKTNYLRPRADSNSARWVVEIFWARTPLLLTQKLLREALTSQFVIMTLRQANAGKIARGTKRKMTSSFKTTRASKSTKDNRRNSKLMGKSPSPSSHDAKGLRARSSPGKRGTTDEATETPLEALMNDFHQIRRQHHSMTHALAEAREANKELEREKSALEIELEHISESLEEESESLGKLKAENGMLQDTLAKQANGTVALARKRAANKKLKKENAALMTELENIKEEHQDEVAKEVDRLAAQQKANSILQQQIVNLRSELEQLSKLLCRSMESFSVQTRLLQEQCKTLVSPVATSNEVRNPTEVTDALSSQSNEE